MTNGKATKDGAAEVAAKGAKPEPRRYDPSEAEPRWNAYWKERRIYAYDPTSGKPIYSIDTPPPYASADHLHVGHAMHYSQFEFVARYKRMRGYNVFFPMGYDDNGLPTERFVEKKHTVNKQTISRADFIRLCMEETKRCGQTYYDLFTALGFSIDWDLLYQTIGDRARTVAQASFLDLHRKGLLLHEDAPTTWCMSCQTTIAQADFENVEMTSSFNDIAFASGGKQLVIATTRPELLPACVALFAHPGDERYRGLKGKFAKVPLFNHEVPILFDEKADPEKGTGLMMCCTFGDKEDIEKWYTHRLPLRMVFTEDGRMDASVPVYAGLRIREARARIIEDLKAAGFLLRQQPITHAVNVHERCSTEIEFLKKRQWAIRVLDRKEELIKAGRKVRWFPDHMRIRYEHWVQNLNWDWNISRQRYYGVPFPVWYCAKCGAVKLPGLSELPVDPREESPKGACSCGSVDFRPEMDVMDTWMVSSVTPQINAHWTMADERKGFLPMSLRPQAHDIIRTWAFYTIVKSYYHDDAIPWNDIMISGHGQDAKGQKMSKSKGNFIVAQEMIKKYSADALRFWAAGVKLGDDLPFMEKDLQTGQKTVTKLWNAIRFSLTHLEDYQGFEGELAPLDRWLLSKFNRVVKEATEYFDRYEYSRTKLEAEKFFWQAFCDNYLELVKDRLYSPEKYGELSLSAKHTLYSVSLGILKLFAPIMPHITEELYQLGYKARDGAVSIHVSRWPEYREELLDEAAERLGDEVVAVVAAVRKYKSEQQLSMKAPLKKIIITTLLDLTLVEQELLAVTGAETLEHRKGEFNVEIENQ